MICTNINQHLSFYHVCTSMASDKWPPARLPLTGCHSFLGFTLPIILNMPVPSNPITGKCHVPLAISVNRQCQPHDIHTMFLSCQLTFALEWSTFSIPCWSTTSIWQVLDQYGGVSGAWLLLGFQTISCWARISISKHLRCISMLMSIRNVYIYGLIFSECVP